MALIYRIIGFFDETVPDLFQNVIEFGIIFRWNLDSGKNLPNILEMQRCVESVEQRQTCTKQELLSPAPWFR